MVWEDQAMGVYWELKSAYFSSPRGVRANLAMAAMIGLAHVPGCPSLYHDQTARLVLDGVPGEQYGVTMRLLSSLVGE